MAQRDNASLFPNAAPTVPVGALFSLVSLPMST
jgi:hypothetical protein